MRRPPSPGWLDELAALEVGSLYLCDRHLTRFNHDTPRPRATENYSYIRQPRLRVSAVSGVGVFVIFVAFMVFGSSWVQLGVGSWELGVHSALSAAIGSTRAARRAGRQLAVSVATISAAQDARATTGSNVLTSNSNA